MVGHTGVFDSCIQTIHSIDRILKKLEHKALETGYALFITADHGNIEYMKNNDGSPNTAHTCSLVPFLAITPEKKSILERGQLADVAPTVLTFLGYSVPLDMTGKPLWDN
jgi:2,3-bisphosphoglycerate-independent phosphoglycerate mutase